MTENFIPYEEALALKELGFDEDCLVAYNCLQNNDRSLAFTQELYGDINLCSFDKNSCNVFENLISAPLYQQAFKWFRDKYNLQLGICHHVGFDCWTNGGDLLENGKYCDFKTYEEAELECLRKLIKIAKRQ